MGVFVGTTSQFNPTVSSPSSAQVIRYNGTAWVNGSAPGWQRLADTTLLGAAASIDFSSIAAGYAALRVIINGQKNAAGNIYTYAKLNNDGASTYIAREFIYDGTAVNVNENKDSVNGCLFGILPGSTANAWGGAEMLLFNQGSTGYKSYVSQFANPDTPYIGVCGGWWPSTTEINQITIIPSAGSFNTGTRAQLFGVVA